MGSNSVSYRALLFRQGAELLRQERAAQAIAPFLQALNEPGPGAQAIEILGQLAAAYRALGKNEEAFRTFLDAADADPDRAVAFWREARGIVTAQLSTTMWPWMQSEWLEQWLGSPPAMPLRGEPLLLAAKVALSAGESLKALSLLKEAAEAPNPDSAISEELIAQLDKISDGLTRTDDFANSAEALRLAIRIKPPELRRYWSLMDVLYRKSFEKTAPFVNREDIHQSVAAWNDALAFGSPKSTDAWAWTARAVVNEQLIRLPESNAWQLAWEATAHCERGLLLDEDDVWSWTNLGRWHRYLNLPGCDDFATQTLLEVQGGETTAALDERIIYLSNAGRFEEMEGVVKRRREIEDSTWLGGVVAFEHLHRGENAVAIELAAGYLNERPDINWCREVLAAAYRRMGDSIKAAEEYQSLLNICGPENRDDQPLAARSAYYLGETGRAISIAETYLSKYAIPTDRFAQVELGLFCLADGKLERSQELISAAIPTVRNTRSLEELLRFDLSWTEQTLRTLPHGERAQEILDHPQTGVKARIRARILELSQRPPATEDELKEMLATYGRESAGGWLAVAVELGLARLCRSENRAGAAAAYRSLVGHEPAGFSVSRDALDRLAQQCVEEGDKLMPEDPAAAAERYVTTLDLAPAEEITIKAGARAGLVFASASAGSVAETAAELERLAAAAPEIAPDILGQRFRSLAGGEQILWTADSTLESIAATLPAHRPQVHAAIESARTALLGKLNEWYGASDSTADRWPVATPIVLEIGNGLIPADTSENWVLFKTYIPEMRKRIEEKTGIVVPGVRVRGATSTDLGIYKIAIADVARPTEGGSVPTDRRFCPASLESLKQLGIDENRLIAGRRPGKSAHGYWVSSGDYEAVTEAGLELWDEPLYYVIRQLEISIVRHLDEVLGTDEAWKIAEKWREAPETKDLVESVFAFPADRVHFSRLARVMLRDGVPLLSGHIILTALRDKPLNAVSFPSVIRQVRLQLRDSLPGNGRNVKRINLAPEWEKTVSSWATGPRSTPEPAQVHEFVHHVRETLSHAADGSREVEYGLVVQSPPGAALVRKMLRHEIADLGVLAGEEVA